MATDQQQYRQDRPYPKGVLPMKRTSLLVAGFLVVGGAAANPAPKLLVVEIKNSSGQSVGTATLTDAGPGVPSKLRIHPLHPLSHYIHIPPFPSCHPAR